MIRILTGWALRVVATLAVVAVGIYLGGHPSLLPGPVRSALITNDDQRRFSDALAAVEDTYYRKISRARLTDDAIAGMVAKLDDPYSRYMTAAEYKELQQREQQLFVGIGVGVERVANGLRIIEVYPRSPAQAAGLRAGQTIVKVGDRELKGMVVERATALIKGPEGTKVSLAVGAADGKRRAVDVTRREVIVPQVSGRTLTHRGSRYRLIRISGFTQDSVTAAVRGQIATARRGRMSGLILDLRSNPGGFVDKAQQVASLFLAKNATIVTMRGRTTADRTLRAVGEPVARKTPLVVLVDANSASAAEIVAGALKDDGRATIVGTRTYGKGVFQSVIPMRDGGALHLTAGQYFTPKGTNLGGSGIAKGSGLKPNIEAKDNLKTRSVDEAVEAALRTLASQRR